MEENKTLENTELDNDAILPEGWNDGDDFFDDKNWSGAEGETAEEDDFFADEAEVSDTVGAPAAGAPTTETAEETPTPAGEVTDTEETPTTESTEVEPAAPRKIRFKATSLQFTRRLPPLSAIRLNWRKPTPPWSA